MRFNNNNFKKNFDLFLKCLNKPRAFKSFKQFFTLLLTFKCILIEIDTFASFKTLGDDFNTAEPFGIANGRLSQTAGVRRF